MLNIELTLTFSEYKMLKGLANSILGIESRPKVRKLLNKSEEELERLLFEEIKNNRIEKGLYYKGDVILLMIGFIRDNIDHSLRINLGKVLIKNGFYKNTKTNLWKIK